MSFCPGHLFIIFGKENPRPLQPAKRAHGRAPRAPGTGRRAKRGRSSVRYPSLRPRRGCASNPYSLL